MNWRSSRAHYGWDAPGIMLGLSLGGATVILAGWLAAGLSSGMWRFGGIALAVLGTVPLFFGLLMLVYGLAGKMRTRDLLLAQIAWRGDETILDVGTGAGLLLIGAAKRLPRGRAVGIDVWAAKDLSGNGAERTRRNAHAEGVADRVDIVTGDARAPAFADASFDHIVSLLCLHNIDPVADRLQACREIARLVRPGGRVVIGDYVPTHDYAAVLDSAGLTIIRSRQAFATAMSLMWVVVAEKPGPGSR